MEFSEYQEKAKETDQDPATGENHLVIPLLGLAGESADLLTEYKKRLRDKDAHKLFFPQIGEELGDILWYLSTIATKLGLDLDEIAGKNLEKTRDRWLLQRPNGDTRSYFDATFPPQEQLPRQFEATFSQVGEAGGQSVTVSVSGDQLGATIRDNSYEDDGYRFHDVFHLSYLAHLGWSPVIRSLMKRKRKSDARIDEVEDGGRAIVIDEAIAAYVHMYAKDHGHFEGTDKIDFSILKTIKSFVGGLEVRQCTYAQWERAILDGYRVWRELIANGGGRVAVDVTAGTIEYLGA